MWNIFPNIRRTPAKKGIFPSSTPGVSYINAYTLCDIIH